VSRAFVAVVPPREVLDAVGKMSWRAAHRPAELALPRLLGPRWTTRDQWHLTLQFLGNGVDLDAAAAALTTVRGTAVPLRLGRVGGFRNEKRATVVWLGVLEGARELSVLARAVKDAMIAVVPEPGAREYHPHLTLARLARGADLRAAVAAAGRAPIGPRWVADRITLFESVSGSSGHGYRPHAEIVLDPRDSPSVDS
jgi:2'-5' RNA ligase